jgi:TonB family protein
MDLRIREKANSLYALPRSAVAIRITFILSVLFHVALFAGMQTVFPIHWLTRPLRTYEVDLLRPPVEALDRQNVLEADLSRLTTEEPTPPEPSEDTISLDTEDKRYSSYAGAIKEQLLRHWQYPPQATENLIEGDVLVLFTLDRKGSLINVKVLQPSSHGLLDGETLRTIRSAAPFPPFPGSVTVKRLHIKANFAYRLTSRR